MNYLRKWQLALVCLLALALLPFAPAPRGTAQVTGYTVTDLGTLGGDASRAYGLDECGNVVGEAQAVSGSFRPFLWSAGAGMTDLGTLGGSSGRAQAINQNGVITGAARNAGGTLRAFVMNPGGTPQDIGSLGGPTVDAFDINILGQVVGVSEETGGIQDRAFLWQTGIGMQGLTAPWGTPIRAFGINDSGQIAGTANHNVAGVHAFVTIGSVGNPVDLGTLGGAISFATEVNNAGEVSGYAHIFSETAIQSYHAFRWKDVNGNGQSDSGEMLDLGTLGGRQSYAQDINNAGVVVGRSEMVTGSSDTHAFIWQDANSNGQSDSGELKDLNTIVPGTNWTFQEARAINDRGQIVGFGLNPAGKVHAFLLTPNNVGPSPCDPTPTPTPVPGAIQFSAATYTVGEDGNSVVISVSRTGGGDGAVSVNYATTTGGTATAGSDYTAASGTLNFADGEVSKTFSVLITDDTLDEANETVNLALSNPTGGATLGAQATAVLTITDNDAQPSLQFSAATYSVVESSATATITVTRTGGTNGGVTVNYATSNGTAIAGSDYAATSGTLTFAEGEVSKSFTVTINPDALDEPNETVNLTLSSPGGGGALGTPTTAVLTITDDDATPLLSIDDVTVIEGNTGSSPATTATFVVRLTGASAQTVTVNYNTTDGTATTANNDYVAASGTVTFNPGETGTKNVNVSVIGDTTDEPNETFGVQLSAPTNATFELTPSASFGVGTITDDDGTPALNIDDVTVTEGNSGQRAATFTVLLLPASGQTVTVNYATANGTAAAGTDYAATSGTLTFDPGQTSKTITVQVNGDTTPEAHENFVVNLSGATNATLGDAEGQGTINNDDTSLAINDLLPGINEGNTGATNFVFTVSLSHVSVLPVTVNYATADDTATTSNNDYVATSGTLTFDPGQTSKTITVNVNGDTTFENDEVFVVNLSGATNAAIGDAQGSGRILNDEAASFFQFSGGPTFSVAESGGTATFTITRSGSTAGGATVNYSTANGTATAGSDYTAVSGTFTFAEGETSKTFDVSILDDTLDEPDETVIVSLTGGFGATLSTGSSVTLNITDDDTQPTLQFSAATYSVGESGTATITVTRTGGTNATTVNYFTSDGTASAGSDYIAASGTLTFAEGDNSESFNVTINPDTLDEPDETINLALSAGAGAALGAQSTATLTIADDDATPALSINDVTVTEGNAGQTTADFTVTLSAPSGQTVTVAYATANGTATQPSDYTATSNTLSFSPGVTTRTISVPVVGDTLDEPDESFSVTLSNPSSATISDGTGIGTITNDDAAPAVSVNDVTVAEGDTGKTNAAFTVSLSAASGRTVTVNVATSDGTATAGSDYTAVSFMTLTFNPGETLATVNISVLGDTVDEPNETFNVVLSSPTNVTIADGTGIGTITDDDGTPALSINDVTVTEGNAGNTAATFTVTLAPASGQTVTVAYASADGTANAGPDYGSTASLLTFLPGETTKTITVNVFGDTSNEADETFFVNLSGVTNAGLADAQGQGTIINDDAPTLHFSQATYPVGESAHFVTVTVTRSGDPSQAVGVNFATSDGTATERRDYTAVSGRLRFAAGETSKTFDVLLTEDAYTEPEETINLTLSNPTGGAALGSQSSATVNLAADDNPPPGFNPIDISSDFVRQHYHDFLNREPDASGLQFWTNEIESCGTNTQCREVKRINVSAAFFQSIEFQQTGYLVYRTYKAAYGDATSPNVDGTVPVVRLQEFLPDTRSIGEGVIVNQGDWQAQLEANKNSYMAEFVQRQRFLTAYPLTMTAAQFVDKLNQNAGGVLTQSERDQLVTQLSANPADAVRRATALRSVSENNALQQNEFRRAFVLMQFYGYLRRNPDDPQDVDFRGWKFWLDKLNQFNGNFIDAEMVKAFLDSIEYRTRFAP